MPREHILAATPPFHPVVGWGNGTSVQMAIAADDDGSIFWHLLDSQLGVLGHELVAVVEGWKKDFPDEPSTDAAELERNTALAAAVLNTLDVVTSSHAGGYSSLWATMDRGGVNDLIRILRRARNAAFGADE